MAHVSAKVQTIDQLRTAELGGLVTIRSDPKREAELDAAYKNLIGPLNRFTFWKCGPNVEYRPDKGLWLPQRRAVAFVHAYMAARSLLPDNERNEAALIKMPTGTGKTAVIAALACASSITARTLVVTPRAALVHQMRDDLSYRFWGRLGAIYHSGKLHENIPKDERERLETEIKNGALTPVRELNSEHYLKIFHEKDDDRQIIVSTFNALHLVLGIEPPAHRSMYGREPREVARSLRLLDDDEDEIDAKKITKNIDAFRKTLEDIDLVVVDEGHYEPAYSWAQAVRKLQKPTIILSATPYRNDYKYFQVEGRYVFNLPWQEAVRENLIRDVQFEGLSEAARSPGALRGPPPKYSESVFVADCRPLLAKLPKDKKVIVRAGSWAALKRLQRAFFNAGEEAVVIHHRFTGKELQCPDLKTAAEKKALQPLRFQHVRQADRPDSAADKRRIWMHESKLLEGIDRPEFIEIWIYDGFGNARELVQQVGRAIRRPNLKDSSGKVATVRGSAKRLLQFEGAPTVAQTSATRWENYLAFETYAAKEFKSAFVAETQLLATLKRTAPAVQYIAREFRRSDLLDEPQTMAAFMLPRRGMFCRVDKIEDHGRTAIASKLLNDMQDAALEAMELEERFDIRPVAIPPGRKFADARLIRYLAWSNSPYLATHHIPEWRLGLMAIVRAGRYLVLLDTENLCLDTSRFALLQPEPPELQRLFPKTTAGTTRIVETDAVGLDMNERALRSISVRRHALQEGYFDIAESSQVPSSVSGFSPFANRISRRRVSFLRSTVSDASSRPVRLGDYIDWVQAIGDELANEAVEGLDYFGRFAKRITPLPDDQGVPTSILLDLWDVLKADDETYESRNWRSDVANRILERGNTCYVIQSRVVGNKVEYFFNFEIDNDDGTVDQFEVGIAYRYRATVPPTARYALHSETLNTLLEVAESTGTDEPGAFGKPLPASLTRMMNQEQSFRIIPTLNDVVYAHSHFYVPEVGLDVLSVLESAAEIANVVSEKGDTRLTNRAEWDARTMFGLVYGWFNQAPSTSLIAGDFRNADLLINPDGSRELCDFFTVSESEKKVLIVHAKSKAGAGGASARELEEVGRQAQTSLAFAGSSHHQFAQPNVWGQRWQVRLRDAANIRVEKPRIESRVPLAGTAAQRAAAAHSTLKAALNNPSFAKEIVILTSGILSIAAATAAFHSANTLDRQFVYYLASLRTSFDRAGVKLRIVGNA